MSICGGIAGYRGYAPLGIMIHNDDGSINATADVGAEMYRTGRHDLNNGFTHAHADSVHVVEVEDDMNKAWHCGDTYHNNNFLSIEVDQSRGADDDLFIKNENNALKGAAEKCIKYGIEPNAETIKLHREVYATDCPARSLAMHGGTIESCKAYFIEKVKKYMKGETDEEEGQIMECTFSIVDHPDYKGVFYFDGKGIKGLACGDEGKILQDIYAVNHDGKQLPHFEWSVNAPGYQRLLDVANREYVTNF